MSTQGQAQTHVSAAAEPSKVRCGETILPEGGLGCTEHDAAGKRCRVEAHHTRDRFCCACSPLMCLWCPTIIQSGQCSLSEQGVV